MGNQQRKTEDTDLAWLAGFLDGEGSFVIIQLAGKRLTELLEKNQRPYIAPRIVLVNTDEPTLGTVMAILDAHELPYHVSRRVGGINVRGNKNADSWDLRVQGMKRCKRWLDVLTPYLHTKKSQAQAMLDLIDSRLTDATWGEGYSGAELALIESLRKRPRFAHRLHARPA